MVDAISNAVFNGRLRDACMMLKDLWAPFGLEGMLWLIVVLAKHRLDPMLDLDYVICHMVSRLTNLVMYRSQGLKWH